ncbi:nucleotide-diphospho-sugar transferase [Phakopsora pachyrhizi]|uniref:Nucleotide-diphospho-sugar transferase n=1 Tax=Phakopsora pachyrhizi TaxID=170000 RepID=A0AAV0BHS3_PHAPC|nr:nucleotide-diphospho-sugar transferase [Phakopsora pachyrhizi]CAH7685503.1 nucleotide-diphospho-sugar transferase [Phakopsora pachyrhizi]
MYSSLPLDSKDEPSSPSEISSNANTSSESISLPSTPFLFRQPIAQSSTATSAEQQSRRRSWLDYALIILLLVVLGTVTVLSTARSYFGIYPNDVILSSELSVSDVPSRIPKIIHQTWKSSQIPKKWVAVRESCAALHEDWDYKLWTDESGRELIAQEYPWFLDTYDGYPFPIQRADAVRYFILHHYGGVYMDLDIGCLRPMDSLLRFDMVLPQTVPVGISNDLMFSAKRHPFLEFVIHRLANFDHNYHFNYATVMFSTGPMALSALLSQFRNSLPLGPSPLTSFGPVRILPPKMYGKNLPSPQPHPGPFFTHYYGSSWHTDGAGLVLWLGKFGIFFLYGAAAIVLACGARAIMSKLFGCGSSGEQNQHISRSWSQGFASKNRSSGGALWKRRIRRARKAEGKLTDAILLPAHWLERAALSSTSKKFPMKRSHSAKSHEGCKSCKPEANSPYFLDTELPPYESGSSVSYLQLPLSGM